MPAHGVSTKLLISLYHRFDLWCAPEWLGPRLQAAFPAIRVVQLQTYDRVQEEIVDADAALMWSVSPEQFAQAKKLRWIHSTAAAVHQLMFDELVSSNVVVSNAREVHAPVVAEPQGLVVAAERGWRKTAAAGGRGL